MILELCNVRTVTNNTPHNLYIENGYFIADLDHKIQPNKSIDLNAKLVCSGFIETHLHLDKACIMSRCCLELGTLDEAIEQTSKAKKDFTENDIYLRGKKVLEQAIVKGTMHIRTHVELDPTIGLTGFYAILKLKHDFAWAIDIQICVFPQEGLTNSIGTEALLNEALLAGADVIGGCPYTDTDPEQQIERIFLLAQQHNVDVDFHFDFDLSQDMTLLNRLIEKTYQFDMQHRVTIGHATRLSTLNQKDLSDMAQKLSNAGIRVTTLPSTDLFLNGRNNFALKPRGVAPIHELAKTGVLCSISSNNIGNPFTPYGDASLVRQANLYANIAQLGTAQDLVKCLNWISTEAAKVINLNKYGLTLGCQADFLVFDAESLDQIIAENLAPLMGFKRGKQTFQNKGTEILLP